jgi:hypothetical protein
MFHLEPSSSMSRSPPINLLLPLRRSRLNLSSSGIRFQVSYEVFSCIMLANMMQLASLTLRILKSLYPWADLDMAGEGFIVTCSGKEALRLVEDSAMTVGHIVDMLPVDMSLG